MPKFTVEELQSVMNVPLNIRNLSIIAHVDHGKTTLTDSLIAGCGLIPMDQAGQACHTDSMKLEKEKGITIKSTGISLYFDLSESQFAHTQASQSQDPRYIINLVDSPGHVDFSSEVTAALRVTDGALVVVDCVEGVCVQTETVLRQALTEKIKPTLCINKLDRAFMELQLEAEEMYQSFQRIIESVNSSVSTFVDEAVMGDLVLSPEKGNVAFCAGKQAWAFTLNTFARLYAKRFGYTEKKMLSCLWGDNYWDDEAKEWSTSSVSKISGKKLQRGFCKFVLEPIKKVFELASNNRKQEVFQLLQKVDVQLRKEDQEKEGKDLIKSCMQNWLPAHVALVEMIINHLPSPVVAQRYRVADLYEGPQDDKAAESIRNCDPSGPLMIFVSKLVQDSKSNKFVAFGRVFSGTARSGMKVRVLNTNYIPGSKDNIALKTLQRTLVMMGKNVESMEDVPCGNTIGLVGVDDAILKTATITSDDDQLFPLKQMKYSVSPVVRCAVEPVHPGDLLKLLDGLKKLARSDSLVQCHFEETGEHVIAAAGELHMEVCLAQLKELCNVEFTTSDPVVTFKETVTAVSSINCLSKSPNKHNRLYFSAQPLGEDLTLAIEDGKISALQDPKSRMKSLSFDFNWNPDEGKKIWCFGPNNSGANIVVDMSKGQQMIHEIKDSVSAAFQWVTDSGVLCEESLRGCRFNIIDAHLHADAIHRGAGQIIPTARRACFASMMTAQPRLQEPIFLVEIQCPQGSAVSSIFNVLNKRRGYIIEQSPKVGTPLCAIKAHLPVMESFGFTGELRAATSGTAFPQMMFDHWSLINSDPFAEGKAKDIITTIRKRKGLPLEIPPLDKFLDKLTS
eukprot:TRINITY_DN1649_c0_g1_i1.p1 TRINITY_DN1649_c0_g1~~TRINITY_DN1649_c0_g1_i1.p1  ORF type:complete len:848 (-),score=228.32 TRINITY_DN1649_c0_g1_i1:31-2574(-)